MTLLSEEDLQEAIRSHIKSCALVIAEVSENDPNVFSEIGYAWGLGRPTILIVYRF
jgi:nucleoside 2-deoxyribosyltransferase